MRRLAASPRPAGRTHWAEASRPSGAFRPRVLDQNQLSPPVGRHEVTHQSANSKADDAGQNGPHDLESIATEHDLFFQMRVACRLLQIIELQKR